MYLIVTIDTEEDNWGEFARRSCTVQNLQRIPRIHELFVRYGVIPTYLISHPVAISEEGAGTLGRYRDEGSCEIGAHPHPGNTPPVEEEPNDYNSYLSNLPSTLQYRKIEALTRTIESRFGVKPTTYRSGRWGFDEGIARHLIRLGYTVDTSVFPVWDWTPGPDFRSFSHEPFVYEVKECPGGGRLLEIPVTVDFLQSPRALVGSAFNAIQRAPFGRLVLGGLSRIGAINRICLSPEVAEVSDMIRLADAVASRGGRVLNFFFHSPTLLEGCTPFTRTPADVEDFVSRIDKFLAYATSAGFEPATPSRLTPEDLAPFQVRALAPQAGLS